MNAIDFLIKEHEKVKKTLNEISTESHRGEKKRKMFEILCSELIRHETMEHQIWYPHFKNDKRLSETVKHLLAEEKSAEKAIKKFDNIDTSTWEIHFEQFKKAVIHHAEEEEHQLFPEVKKLLDEEQLEKIGLDMRRFKQDYQSEKGESQA